MAEARQYGLPFDSITSDAVVYAANGTQATLVQTAQNFYLFLGTAVVKTRPLEILDLAEFLMTVASAGQDTARFPRPALIGATFLKSPLIATSFGMKQTATLVTIADISAGGLTDANAVYWGITGGGLGGSLTTQGLADITQMGTGAMERAFEEIKQFYISHTGASS